MASRGAAERFPRDGGTGSPGSPRWQEFHEMTRVSPDDKSFMRWQESHEMTGICISCINYLVFVMGKSFTYTCKYKNICVASDVSLTAKIQVKVTFPPETWNHPMVITDILVGTLCLKHARKCWFCTKQFLQHMASFKNISVGSNRINIQAMDTFILANCIEFRPESNGRIPALSKYR